jgi:hypothetical protein
MLILSGSNKILADEYDFPDQSSEKSKINQITGSVLITPELIDSLILPDYVVINYPLMISDFDKGFKLWNFLDINPKVDSTWYRVFQIRLFLVLW